MGRVKKPKKHKSWNLRIEDKSSTHVNTTANDNTTQEYAKYKKIHETMNETKETKTHGDTHKDEPKIINQTDYNIKILTEILKNTKNMLDAINVCIACQRVSF